MACRFEYPHLVTDTGVASHLAAASITSSAGLPCAAAARCAHSRGSASASLACATYASYPPLAASARNVESSLQVRTGASTAGVGWGGMGLVRKNGRGAVEAEEGTGRENRNAKGCRGTEGNE